MIDKNVLAYVIGIAIGDGNLSNPNGRAIRLRVTCDTKYKNIISEIIASIKILVPKNKVSIVHREKNYIDISCYSNKWEKWLGWKVGYGSKVKQNISIPTWIKNNKKYSIKCLKGLLETDGSVYLDKNYKMVNFTTVIPKLAKDIMNIIIKLDFYPHLYTIKDSRPNRKTKYIIRLSKNVTEFLNLIKPLKDIKF